MPWVDSVYWSSDLFRVLDAVVRSAPGSIPDGNEDIAVVDHPAVPAIHLVGRITAPCDNVLAIGVRQELAIELLGLSRPCRFLA